MIYTITVFFGCTINLLCNFYQLNILFGVTAGQYILAGFAQTSELLIINKSGIGLNQNSNINAESIIVALIKRMLNMPETAKITAVFAAISIQGDRRTINLWMQFYDTAKDIANNLDATKLLHPMDY